MSNWSTGRVTSSSLPLTSLISVRQLAQDETPSHALSSVKPLALTIFSAWSRMLDMSIPTTSSAPALDANMERIPVPHPTYCELGARRLEKY